MRRLAVFWVLTLFVLLPSGAFAQGWAPGLHGGTTPTGPCGGDLSGTYPNCYVKSVSGASDAGGAVPLSAGAFITSASGSNSYIDLTAAAASYGYGKYLNYVEAPAFDTTAAGALAIAPTNATSIVEGNATTVASWTGNLKTGSTYTWQINSAAAATLTSTQWNPGVDNTLAGGTAALRFASMNAAATGFRVWGSGTSNPTAQLGDNGGPDGFISFGPGGATALDTRIVRSAAHAATLDDTANGDATWLVGGTANNGHQISVAAGATPTISVAGTGGANAAASNLLLSGQNPNATNGTPGSVEVDIAAPTGTGKEAGIVLKRAGTQYLYLGGGTEGAAYVGFWGTPTGAAMTNANYTFFTDGGNTYFNAASGVLVFSESGTILAELSTAAWHSQTAGGLSNGTAALPWGSAFLGYNATSTAYTSIVGSSTAETISGPQAAVNTAAVALNVTGLQGGNGSSSVGSAGGAVNITGGAGGAGNGTNMSGGVGAAATLIGGNGGTSTGTAANANAGGVSIDTGAIGTGGSGANPLGANVSIGQTNAYQTIIDGGGSVSVGTNRTGTTNVDSNNALNLGTTKATSIVEGNDANTATWVGHVKTVGSYTWDFNGLGIYQMVASALSPVTDDTPSLGSASKRWGSWYTQGESVTSTGAGGNATQSTPWAWQQTNAVSLGNGGTVTLSAAQYATPVIELTASGALTSTGIIVLPNVSGFWLFDITGLNADLGTFGIQFKSGTATSGTITALNTTTDVVVVITRGSNTIAILQ